MPILYLVGTPIGNLEDITYRAVRTLREVDVIAAEDTRNTGKLLAHYEIKTPQISYHEHSSADRVAEIVERLAAEDIALVSDAGMPTVSDPGYRLVRAAIDAGYRVVPIPGPSAALTALVASGLPTDTFLFIGFLPRQKAARRALLSDYAGQPHTLIAYESPHRLLDALADIDAALGERQVCVGRELTKLYEELWRGTARAAQAHFSADKVRGEITLLIAGADSAESEWDEDTIRAALITALADGASTRDAAAQIAAQSGWRKRKVYALAVDLQQPS